MCATLAAMNIESMTFFTRAYRVPHTVGDQTHAIRKITRPSGETVAWCKREFKNGGDEDCKEEINCPDCLKALGGDS